MPLLFNSNWNSLVLEVAHMEHRVHAVAYGFAGKSMNLQQRKSLLSARVRWTRNLLDFSSNENQHNANIYYLHWEQPISCRRELLRLCSQPPAPEPRSLSLLLVSIQANPSTPLVSKTHEVLPALQNQQMALEQICQHNKSATTEGSACLC